MKKYFLLSVAALGLVFGCQKKEYSTPDASINDNSPALVKLNLDVPGAVLPGTKAAGSVDEWGGQKLTLLAYADGEDWTEEENSLFTKPIETKAPANGWGPTLVDVKQTAQKIEADGSTTEVNDAPVYYKDDRAYDFFGYYLDDLAEDATLTTTADAVTIDLTIDGTQDIMAAKTDVKMDLETAGMSGKIAEADVYSAFSARRNVIPCLRFDHMLARFNFYVVAASKSAADIVSVEEIQIQTPVKGTLQVAGKGREAFVPTFKKDNTVSTAAYPYLSLKESNPDDGGKMTKIATKKPYDGFYTKIDEFKNTPEKVLEEEHAEAAKIGSSVMVIAGEGAHNVIVKTKNTDFNLEIPDLKLTINANEIKTPDGTTLDSFKAGYQYDVILMIYGPEEVKVSAYLSEWKDGGFFSHDPEDDDIIEPAEPTAKLASATATSLEFAIEVPNTVKSVFAVLNQNGQQVGVKSVAPATKAWMGTVEFTGLTRGLEYECTLMYYNPDGELVTAANTVKAVPSDITARGAAHVFDLNSYIQIPAEYRAEDSYNGRDKYIALYYDELEDLAGATVTVMFNGAETKIKDGAVEAGTLMKFTADKLFGADVKELKAGKYEITMKKGESTSVQTVTIVDSKFKVNKIYVVKNEETYKTLPAAYQLFHPYKTTMEAEFPWIVLEVTENYDTPLLVTATPEGGEAMTVSVADYELGVLILDKTDLGVQALSGKWTVEVNNVAAPESVTL